MCLIFGLMGCGQSSVIKSDVKAKTFAEAYGDGKLLRKSFPLIITKDPFDSPLPNLGFIAGGIAKMIANIGIALGAGRTEMYFHQQTPEFPEMFKEVRIKRVFFYIEPKSNGERRAHWFSRLFRGKGDVDFDFIKKLVIRLRPEVPDMKKVCLIEDQGKYEPLFPCKDPTLTSEKTDRYLDYFKITPSEREPDLTQLDEFVLLKYAGNKREEYIMNSDRGVMYMIRTTRPGETFHFFDTRKGYGKVVEDMKSLDNVILVELKKGPAYQELFETQLSKDAQYIDANLGVEQIEECNPSICLDIKVDDANLVPFLQRFNSNRIDAFIDAGKVPETFQLKGFLDFEIGADLPF